MGEGIERMMIINCADNRRHSTPLECKKRISTVSIDVALLCSVGNRDRERMGKGGYDMVG